MLSSNLKKNLGIKNIFKSIDNIKGIGQYNKRIIENKIKIFIIPLSRAISSFLTKFHKQTDTAPINCVSGHFTQENIQKIVQLISGKMC